MKLNKYRVSTPERRTLAGKVYSSRAEMQYARFLSLERDCKDGGVLDYIEQPRVWLGIRLNVYVPDFLVIPKDGVEPFFVDVKGVETAAFKKNKRLWKQYGRLALHVVEIDRNGHVKTREIIQPNGAE